jgi:hypothetical protein
VQIRLVAGIAPHDSAIIPKARALATIAGLRGLLVPEGAKRVVPMAMEFFVYERP